MTQYDIKNTTPSHTDITRLRKGQVGGQVCFNLFFISYLKKTTTIQINSFGQSIQAVLIKEKMQQ